MPGSQYMSLNHRLARSNRIWTHEASYRTVACTVSLPNSMLTT